MKTRYPIYKVANFQLEIYLFIYQFTGKLINKSLQENVTRWLGWTKNIFNGSDTTETICTSTAIKIKVAGIEEKAQNNRNAW